MKDADPLDLETRRRVWRELEDRPGQYLRELQRATGLAMGALEYHLSRLERAGLVEILQDGHKRFFPRAMPAEDRQVVAFLRPKTPRRILVGVLQHPAIGKADLARSLHVARSSFDYHVARLVAAGLVRLEQREQRVVLFLADPERVERLLIAHRATFFDRMVDAFAEGLDALQLAPRE